VDLRDMPAVNALSQVVYTTSLLFKESSKSSIPVVDRDVVVEDDEEEEGYSQDV